MKASRPGPVIYVGQGAMGAAAPRGNGQAGQALLTTMIVAACLLPLGAFAAMQARLDFLVAHYTRTAAETFAVAESGLEHALADFSADPRFDRLLAGPDRQIGTPDDAEYPFVQAPPQFFPRAPFRYEVRVATLTAELSEISARGFGPMGATHVVVATVLRTLDPYLPAALSLAARDPTLVVDAGFRIAGVTPASDEPGLPAVAVDGGDAAAGLVARLPPGAQLVGRGGDPSIAAAALPAPATMAAAAARRSDAQTLGSEARGRLDGLFVTSSSLRLADVEGSGVLVVGGTLELGGSSHFAGLIVALGDVRLDPGNAALIDGALVAGGVVSLRGDGQLAYAPQVIARIDAEFPGLLPRRARVTGWHERPDAAL